MRRILIIGIGAIVLVGVALAVYFLFFANGNGGNAPEVVENPFGTAGDYMGPNGEPQTGPSPLGALEGQAGQLIAPKLVKITDEPVAYGVVSFRAQTAPALGTSSPAVYDTEVRYIERASGNVYAYRIGERTLSRISNRTLPGAVEASWLSDGSLAYVRFLSGESSAMESLETYALPVGEDTESGGGYFLEPNLSTVITKGTSTIVTLLPSENGSIASVASADGLVAGTLFASPLASLRLAASGKDYLAYTKAAAQIAGYAFLVNGSTGSFERILGPLRGLTALPSPSGKYVLYTYLSGTTLRTELFDVVNRTSTPVPLGTLSEKCVWENDEGGIYCAIPRTYSGTLPDNWYQGVTSFSDRFWRIGLADRLAVLLLDPSSVADVSVDAVELVLDSEEDALVFTNKKDGSLWAYDL